MEWRELGAAMVEYFDQVTGKEGAVIIYFRYLPQKGDILTVHFPEQEGIESIRVKICSIEHIVENIPRVEPDIIIRTESL